MTGQIRDEVLAGTLSSGSVLRETELAQRFGVSRGPVRDAFLQLSNEGYLAYEPNRGVTVRRPPDRSDREFIADLRRQVESYVVRKGGPDLSAQGLEEARSALEAMRVACTAGDRTALKRADLAFHETILTACGGEGLIPAWKHLCSRMALLYERLDDLDAAYEEHAKIFEALESGDIDGLERALRENIR